MAIVSRWSRRFATALAVVAFAAPASAQPGVAPSAAQVAKARALFDAGGRAYDAAQYDVALQAFQQAYSVLPKDSIVFSIAQANRRLYTTTGNVANRAEAVRLYRQYLDTAKGGSRRGDAARALEELSAGAVAAPTDGAAPPPATAIAAPKTRLYVSSSTPDVSISIDGGPPALRSATAEVQPGPHKVAFSAKGFVDKVVEVDAVSGELVPVTFDLEEKLGALTVSSADGAAISVDGRFVGEAPLASPLALPRGRHFVVAELNGHTSRSATVAVERGEPASADLELDTTLQRDLSIVVFSGSGAALVVAGVFTGLALAQQSKASDILARAETENLVKSDLTDYENARSARDRHVIVAASTGAGAGLLAVVGLGMLLVDPPDRITGGVTPDAPGPAQETPKTPTLDLEEVGAAVGPDGAALTLGFRF